MKNNPPDFVPKYKHMELSFYQYNVHLNEIPNEDLKGKFYKEAIKEISKALVANGCVMVETSRPIASPGYNLKFFLYPYKSITDLP